MIHGLMMTPPVVGRIAIGKVVERQGKRLPEKDDEFTITTQVQNRHGWILHPMDAILRKERSYPVSLPADDHRQAPEPTVQPAPQPKSSLQSKLDLRAREQGVSSVSPVAGEPRVSSAMERAGALPSSEVTRKVSMISKLRSIPVRLLFNDPHLNLRALYTLFDRATARPICVGDGASCKRVQQDTGVVETQACPGPDHCPLGMEGRCKLFGRFHVRIDHRENHSDACSTFVLRTTGINTVRTLMARMHYLYAISGGLLAYLPLELRLRGKSTTQSHRTPIYYVNRPGFRGGRLV